ncbi:MAG: outer membrane lipoprotein carrier protein LolA [Candidatus Cryptobacteroides sp.]
MTRRFISILVSATLLFQAFNAAAGGFVKIKDVKSFSADLAARTSSITSISAEVTQKKFLSVFNAEVVSRGTFAWESPDKLCLDYRTPAPYKIVINGDKLLTVNSGKPSTANLKGNPVMSQMKNLLSSCMTGNVGAMGPDFDIEYYESDLEYKIVLVPTSGQLRGYISRMEIVLDRKDMSVNTLVMYENETDYTSYVFSSKKFNQALPASVFAVR